MRSPGHAARLEPLHELGGGRHADVGRDQRLLQPLPGLVVGGVEGSGGELPGQRAPTLAERVAQAPEETGLGSLLLVALFVPEQGAPRRHRDERLRGDGFAREAPRHDLRDAVGAHRHAVQDVGGLHRLLLVRDDDELRLLGVAAQERDEAADVRRRRGRPRPRRGDRTDAAWRGRARTGTRSRRVPSRRPSRSESARHLLAGRAKLDLDSRLGVLVLALELGLGQPQASLAAGEERRGDFLEVVADRR